MAKLLDKWYDAVVVNDDLDTRHQGAVRVVIIGVTDELKPEQQPWALPGVDKLQSVPVVGTTLRVVFEDGDIQRPRYFQISAEQTALPKEFVTDYPNVAIGYLGDPRFMMTHNRVIPNTIITHPSYSTIIWDSFGTILHESEKGYNNMGQGAKSGKGTKNHLVLTEATIDIFTCTPFGNNIDNGGASQGSEYLSTTHMSKETYDRITNGPQTEQFKAVDNSAQQDDLSFTLINQIDNTSYDVTYTESPNYIETSDKIVLRIITTMSGTDDYQDTANQMLTAGSNYSAHFLVGKTGSPPLQGGATTNGDTIPDPNGFMSFVLTNRDAMFASNLFVSSVNRTAANINAVVVMFIGLEADSLTPFQQGKLYDIVADAKNYPNSKTAQTVKASSLFSPYPDVSKLATAAQKLAPIGP